MGIISSGRGHRATLPGKMRDDPQYWRELCLHLNIEEPQAVAAPALNIADISKATDDIRWRGYLNIPSVIPEDLICRLQSGLDELVSAGIEPVYIYLYDEAWQLFESLRPLLSAILGEDYRTLPNFWAWYLADNGEKGWPPHHDCSAETVFDVGGDQIFMSFSLWVPLVDVEEANGCMYVIPRDQEQKLPVDHEFKRECLVPFSSPLPVSAGSVLGWPQDLIHWGGEYKDTSLPARKSLSFEFQNTAFDPLTEPLLDTGNPPNFETRLKLLDQQFEKYRHITGGEN